MECFICDNEVGNAGPREGDWILVRCDWCTPYRVSGSLAAELQIAGQRLEPKESRAWIEERRKEGEAEPMFTTYFQGRRDYP